MKTKSPLLKAAACMFLLFLFIAPYTLININTLEDNIWFKPALDVAHGQILFRETFSPYGMLVPLLQGVTVKILGPFLLPLRLQAAFLYALTGVLLYYLWSRYMPKLLAFSSVFFWLVLAPFYDDMLLPWSSIYALVLQSLGFFFLTRYAETRHRKYLLLSGSMITLTILTRQPVGVFLGLAAVAYLLFTKLAYHNKLRQTVIEVLILLTGGILTFLPFFIYLATTGSISDWWIQSFVFAREYAQVIRGISVEQLVKSLFLGRYFKMGQFQVMVLWIAIPLSMFFFVVKSVMRLLRKQSISLHDRMFFLAGIVCLGSWLQYYPMTEPTHFFWAVTPMVGFFLYALTKLLPQKRQIVTLFVYLLFCLTVEMLFIRVAISYERFRNTSVYSSTLSFLRGIKISSYENTKINTFYAALTSHLSPADTFINISDDAMIPLLDTRFHQIPPLYEQWNFFAERLYPNYYGKVNDYILAKRPIIVTRTLPYISNYCTLKSVDYPQMFMDIHIPLEQIAKVIIEGQTMTIIPHEDITVRSVTGLGKPLHHFSVPDMKKISPQIVTADRMPLTIRKDTAATVVLHTIPPQVIINLNDGSYSSCTYSVSNNLFYK